MSEDRSAAGPAASDAAPLLRAVARRRAAACADIALADADRLDDWLRITVRALLVSHVRAIEARLRATLANAPELAPFEALHASLAAAHVEIAPPLLAAAGLLHDPELVALLVRRAEEHRFLKTAAAPGERSLLARLITDEDTVLAEHAMALLVAQNRRFDRFQEPALADTELPADLQHRLAWTIAAALRVYLVERHGVGADAADRALAAATARLLAGYDEGETLEARSAQLAVALHDRRRLSAALLGEAVDDGNLPLFVALLAARTGLAAASIWDIVMAGSGRGAALLLRAGDVDRDVAGAVLVRLHGGAGAPVDEARLEAQIDLFDVTSPDQARQALALWRLEPAYRAALARLAGDAA